MRPPFSRRSGWDLAPNRLAAVLDEARRAGRTLVDLTESNPTRSFTRRDDAEALERIADRHGLALVVDEVFADYAHGALAADRLPTFAGRARVLTFVMSGLSKVAALPQLKLGWTLVQGPD